MQENIRPTRVEINLKNLDHNIKVIRDISTKKKIMGIIKANAYGHGSLEIAKRLIQNNIDYLAVAFIEEGIELRKNKIETPILVLGAINDKQIPLFLKYNIDLTGSSIEKLKLISKYSKELNKKANIHIKIDTGMGRIGVQWDRIDEFLKEAFSLPNINIVGLFSHFADSSNDIKYTDIQIDRFKKVLDKINKYTNTDNIIKHLANSGAIENNIEKSFFDMVRPGLIMYGYTNNKNLKKKLKPLMTFKTKVSYFKVLEKGLYIGYDKTYKTKRRTRIVTLPIGYADGYPRSLSNKGYVILRNKKYPIVGRVCMDQSMIDIGMKGEGYNGDDVLLWGKHNKNIIDLMDISNIADRSIYEILCSISQRVPRVYKY